MQGLTAHHLRFQVQALEPISFGNQPGSAIRGALYQALSRHFCSEPDDPQTPDHQSRCPVCWLLAAEDPQGDRGHTIPRAMTVQPPLTSEFDTDEVLTFGITLIGRAQDLMLYLVRAVQMMGHTGIGRGRGKFRLTGLAEYSPLLDAERKLLDGNTIRQPTLHINDPRIEECSRNIPDDHVTLEFITPLRLTRDKRLLKSPEPEPFAQRLIERCQALVTYYAEPAGGPEREAWKEASRSLTAQAARLAVACDETKWVEMWSGSRRQQRYTPISGLVGVVRWEGDVSGLKTWLLWGQSLHVGKNAVKGNGWYRIVS